MELDLLKRKLHDGAQNIPGYPTFLAQHFELRPDRLEDRSIMDILSTVDVVY